MRKKKLKRKGKAHVKGVRYIAKQLKHYQKGKYPSYNKALPDARIIFGKLKDSKQDVILKNIWGFSRTKRIPKEEIPVLPKSLSTPDYYFQLVVVYKEYIKTCTNRIWFESSLSPSTLPIFQGGVTLDTDAYFKDFVSYCNVLKSQTDPNESRYETEWLIYCAKPELDNGKWISKITCVKPEIVDGKEIYTETLYGFNPNDPTAKPRQPQEPQPPKPQEPIKGGESRAEAVRDIIAGLRSDLEKGYINKEKYQKLLMETYNLKKGGNI